MASFILCHRSSPDIARLGPALRSSVPPALSVISTDWQILRAETARALRKLLLPLDYLVCPAVAPAAVFG